LVRISLVLSGQVKPVANPRLGQKILGVGWFGFNFLAKLIDEDAEVLDLLAIIRPPHGLQDSSMRNRDVWLCNQVMKNLGAAGRQEGKTQNAGIRNAVLKKTSSAK
jgi:cell division GTPase FtsZ